MSETAKAARKAMKGKIARLLKSGPKSKIDASDFTPAEPLDADVQTGLRPVSRRQFKKGGKVISKAKGMKALEHAGRKPRKSGGKALTADSLINRNVREANEERDGTKHVGGFKKGGKVRRQHHANGQKVSGITQWLRDHEGDYDDRTGAGAVTDDQGNDYDPNKDGNPPPSGHKRGGKIHRKHRADAGQVNGPGPFNSAMSNMAKDNPAGVPSSLLPSNNAQSSFAKYAGIKRGGEVEGKWIQKAVKHKGALHKALHVPEGEKIPAKKLHKAEHSSNPKLAKRAHLAETLKGLHKADGGGTGDGKRTIRPQNVYSPEYNEEAVNKAITTSRQKIGGREASNIKSLLKGWRGNKAHGGKASHPDVAEDKALIKKMVKGEALKHRKHGGKMSVSDGELQGTRPTGGRLARATGGKTSKGKTNINIVISPHGAGQQPMGGMMPPNGMPRPPGQPVPVAPPAAPPQGMPMPMPVPMPMGGGAPSGAPQMPPMARKHGGRTSYPIKDGAGGGEGRLEKVKAYGIKPVKPAVKNY